MVAILLSASYIDNLSILSFLSGRLPGSLTPLYAAVQGGVWLVASRVNIPFLQTPLHLQRINGTLKMVYYFTSNTVSPSAFVYVGKDKVESKENNPIPLLRILADDVPQDEELIKYGLEEDVWFHVDKLSSAHIYLRMNEGEVWESIPEDLLADCAQLTKANSIEGGHSCSWTPCMNSV